MRRLALVATLLTLLLAVSARSGLAMAMYGGGGGGSDVGAISTYGDNWLLLKTVSFDDPSSITGGGSEKTDTAFFYRLRFGLFGKLDDRNGYKFRLTTNPSCGYTQNIYGGYGGGGGAYGSSCGGFYGSRFGGGGSANPSVSLEHGYLFYRGSDRFVAYAGRVPTYPLSNDLLFSSGAMRGNDRAYDGLFGSFDLADNTNLYLGWGSLADNPGNKPSVAFILGQLKHDFSNALWAYVGTASYTHKNAPGSSSSKNAYSAFFVKGAYDFTPEFNLWGEFLASNGKINNNTVVTKADKSAMMVGASYKASKQWTIEAHWATIGGSSVDPNTSFVADDYILSGLDHFGPSGSVDNDLTYLNVHLHYTVNDHNTAMFDFTNGQENNDSSAKENTGSGFFASWGTTYG